MKRPFPEVPLASDFDYIIMLSKIGQHLLYLDNVFLTCWQNLQAVHMYEAFKDS